MIYLLEVNSFPVGHNWNIFGPKYGPKLILKVSASKIKALKSAFKWKAE